MLWWDRYCFEVSIVRENLTWWQLRDRALQLPLRDRLALLFSLVRFLFRRPGAIEESDRGALKFQGRSTAASLLEHLKTCEGWAGDDLEECLDEVKNTRSPAQFDYGVNPFE